MGQSANCQGWNILNEESLRVTENDGKLTVSLGFLPANFSKHDVWTEHTAHTFTHEHLYVSAQIGGNLTAKRLALKCWLPSGLQLFWRCFELFMRRDEHAFTLQRNTFINYCLMQQWCEYVTSIQHNWLHLYFFVSRITPKKRVYRIHTKLTVKISRQFSLLNSITAVSSHRLFFTAQFHLYWCRLMYAVKMTSTIRTVLATRFGLMCAFFLYRSQIKCQTRISCCKLNKISLFYL